MPLVVRPRARIWPLTGRLRPPSFQFEVIPTRSPLPSGVQLMPLSVLSSKVTCESSGEEPPRVQTVCVMSGTLNVCVAGPLVSWANQLRIVSVAAPLGCTLLNLPPIITLPSGCTATL